MPRVRRTRRWFPLWSVHLRGLQELLWQDLQQPVGDPGVQEQLQVRRRQEEQDGLQGVQAEEVPHGWHVQVRLEVRKEVKLVQDPLPDAKWWSTGRQETYPTISTHLRPLTFRESNPTHPLLAASFPPTIPHTTALPFLPPPHPQPLFLNASPSRRLATS